MTRLALETAIRAWLVLAGVLGGVPNPDRAVIFAHQDGPRPALPYLLVNLVVPSVQIGEDESWADDAVTPKHHIRGNRSSTVSVNAFGTVAYDWLDLAMLRLRAPSVLALNAAAGIAVSPIGGPRDLSGLLDSGTERRWVQDFRVDFVRQTAAPEQEDVVELEQIVHEDTWQGEPSDRIVTITEVL